ncbi:MAG: tyrosine-type recombinase/integrase [Pirellulaceae bacterium]
MASVSAENYGGRVRYRIFFRDENRRRKSIRVTGITKKAAEAIAKRIHEIVSSRISGEPVSLATAEWLKGCPDNIHDRLSQAGIVKTRIRQSATVVDWVEQFIAERRGAVEARTVLNWEATRGKLSEHFAGVQLTDVTAVMADQFGRAMHQDFAKATAAGHIKRTKQFFKQARRSGLIDANPFDDVVAGVQANPERTRFIPVSDIARVIDACPDAEWRLMVALARYGGLRNPSETLSLKWTDIDWAAGMMRISSPKTKKQGKAFRMCLIFAELRSFLEDAEAIAKTGAVYCVERYRSQDVNLRTQFRRIIERAGVEKWPRLWHNLRASRETELTNRFPIHVVTAWLGNSPRVAEQHYLTVMPEHIAMAQVGNCEEGGAGGGAATDRNDRKRSETDDKKSRETSTCVVFPGIENDKSYARQDSNL